MSAGKKLKVFVTGGAGFIGSHVCETLLAAGHSVTAYDNLLLGRREMLASCETGAHRARFKFIEADLLTLEKLVPAMQGHDLVFHLAANSDISTGSIDVDMKNGTMATFNTLHAMRDASVKKIIFASTSAIYGEASVKPTPENYGPLYPISFYGASKLSCEALCSAFAHNCGLQVWAYRFANIVGSHSTHGAIHDFVGRLLKNPDELVVLGNGTQRKSYLHVSDCVRGMLFGYEHSHEGFQLFNLASEGVTTVRFMAEEVVKQMSKVTGRQARLVFGESDRGWVGDVPYTHLDGALLGRMGYQALLKSDEAVKKAVAEIIDEKSKA